jgi:hypothetical protein
VLSGKRLSSFEARTDADLDIQFENGARVVIKAVGGRLAIGLAENGSARRCPLGVWPTTRQRVS